MLDITLRQLRYFDALVRHKQFSRAAQACSVSQPALSMQIRDLEDALGSPLFERGSRSTRLTQFGITLAPRVAAILASVDDLGDFARAARGAITGRLRLGIIPTIAPYLLPEFVNALTDSDKSLELQIRETMTANLLLEIERGDLDLAVLALPVSEQNMREVPLFREQFVLVRPASDADKPVPDRSTLSEMRLLLLEEGHCFRDQALSFCDMQRSRPREILDGSSLSTLVQMVGAGIGITLIPETAIDIETRSAPVSIHRFNTPRPERTIGLVWRKTSPLDPALEKIAAILARSIERLPVTLLYEKIGA